MVLEAEKQVKGKEGSQAHRNRRGHDKPVRSGAVGLSA